MPYNRYLKENNDKKYDFKFCFNKKILNFLKKIINQFFI